MALPSSGAISLQQVNIELGRSSTATISLNDSITRGLFGKASGVISLLDGRGKSSQFGLTIASNLTSPTNLNSYAVSQGWDGASKIVVTINSGVVVSSNTTASPALTIDGSYPGGLEVINNGTIVGMGGTGGIGRWESAGGASGFAGGTALSVSSAVTFTNNGTIAGGGGGGGGGGGHGSGATGGNGGGGRTGLTNAPGGYGANTSPGNPGTYSSAGAGQGSLGCYSFKGEAICGGAGGAGGNWGAGGSNGSATSNGGFGGGGGGGGGTAVSGNGNITWVATGTRFGAIN